MCHPCWMREVSQPQKLHSRPGMAIGRSTTSAPPVIIIFVRLHLRALAKCKPDNPAMAQKANRGRSQLGIIPPSVMAASVEGPVSCHVKLAMSLVGTFETHAACPGDCLLIGQDRKSWRRAVKVTRLTQ